MPTGIDESFDFADPHAAAQDGVKVAMMYLSRNDSKNANPQKILAYHAVGIGVLLGWEEYPGRVLEGYNAGLSDGTEAARQYKSLIAAVGHAPKNHAFIPYAVDFDTNPDDYPKIDAYARGFAAGLHNEFGEGVYGEADVLDHMHSAGLLKGGGFGTYAWSGGRISEWDDFHQFSNGQRLAGASVDFDNLINPTRLGAWWPPNSPYNTGPEEPSLLEEIMALDPNSAQYKKFLSDVGGEVASQLIDALHFLGGAGNNGGDSGAFTEKELEPLRGVLYRLAAKYPAPPVEKTA